MFFLGGLIEQKTINGNLGIEATRRVPCLVGLDWVIVPCRAFCGRRQNFSHNLFEQILDARNAAALSYLAEVIRIPNDGCLYSIGLMGSWSSLKMALSSCPAVGLLTQVSNRPSKYSALFLVSLFSSFKKLVRLSEDILTVTETFTPKLEMLAHLLTSWQRERKSLVIVNGLERAFK